MCKLFSLSRRSDNVSIICPYHGSCEQTNSTVTPTPTFSVTNLPQLRCATGNGFSCRTDGAWMPVSEMRRHVLQLCIVRGDAMLHNYRIGAAGT